MEFLQWTFYGNTLRMWIIALLAGGASFAILEAVKAFLARQFGALGDRPPGRIDDVISATLDETRALWLGVIAVYIATRLLFLPADVDAVVGGVALIAIFVQGALWTSGALRALLRHYFERHVAADLSSASTLDVLGHFIRFGVWAVFTLLALSNLGVEVTALVVGLGVGGVAVALAVQNILGDLFASLAIVLDRPFSLGDFIAVGDLSGTVEHIGLKTTRVRSIAGEQIVFSNGDLLGSRVRNYGRMYERRVVLKLDLTYSTPYETLVRIPAMIREVVEAHDKVRFERAHFVRYGAPSLEVEAVYYVRDPDYDVYMDAQQAINLALFRRLEEEGIEFAMPARTGYANHLGGRTPIPAAHGDSHRPAST